MANQLNRQELETIVTNVVTKALEPIKQDLQKIEGYLYDDTDTGTPGLVQKVREHEKRLSSIEEEKRSAKRMFALIGLGGGALGMVGFEIVKEIIKHYAK